MNYVRPTKRSTGPQPFSVGTHSAKIVKIIRKQTKTKKDMFMIFLEGSAKESGVYFLTFGFDNTQENMNFLLASIEDNGAEIPNIQFGYNPETFHFLTGKDVYIEVEEKEYKGEVKPAVIAFLTLDEFEKSGDEFADQEPFTDEWN